ncbi:MAG TPA: oxidoreductase [Caulobacteraceae bacterium]|jgi:NAD(P)-dependent dehydrogenase (short-subunit alcohol dehydrogenase family)|nr:oxidoreductase [Caulobacteraceae bacterium]
MTRWLITGVSSGLGRALAQAALERGDAVAGTFRRTDQAASFDSLAAGRAHGLIADMADEASVTAAVREAEARLGGIDVLVNNAGYGLVGAVEETSLAEARSQFEVNVMGPLAAIRAALPAMRARRSGRIINVTSVSGVATWHGTGLYCASKHALEAIGLTLAQEVAPLGIRVTNVEPGGLRTDFGARSMIVARERIEDYASTAHQAQIILGGHAGQEAGDPAKAAAAILKIADMDEPPLQLLLGADAVHYASQAAARTHEEFGRFAALSLSIAFED